MPNTLHFARHAVYWSVLIAFAAALIAPLSLYVPPAFADAYEVLTCSRYSF